MIKHRLLALALAIGAVTLLKPQEASAVDSLVVIAYYSDGTKTTLVGQHWHGCGQPSGNWGIQTTNRTLHFPPCS